MRVSCGVGLIVLCSALAMGCKGCEQHADRGDMIIRSHQLLKQMEADLQRRARARVFHYEISSPSARVVHIHERSRWWALLGWLLLQGIICGVCVGIADDKLTRYSHNMRVGLGLSVAALFAVPIVDAAFKREVWVIDANHKRVKMDRTGPIGLFDEHAERNLHAQPVLLASAHVEERESTDKNGNTSVNYVTVTTLDVITAPSGSLQVWKQDESVFKGGEWGTRAYTVAACRLIASKLDGVCTGKDAPKPEVKPATSSPAPEPTSEPVVEPPAPSLQTIPPLETTTTP